MVFSPPFYGGFLILDTPMRQLHWKTPQLDNLSIIKLKSITSNGVNLTGAGLKQNVYYAIL